ncbi:MAG: hypothetical protein E7259_04060 [Lachnospiraceae bacterium]|nr:hypothetical protein [Lachnospiraceae bacterium]
MKNKLIVLLLFCSVACCACKDKDVTEDTTPIEDVASYEDALFEDDINTNGDEFHGSGMNETTENETIEQIISTEEITTENTTEMSGIQVPVLTEEDIYASIIEEYRYLATSEDVELHYEDYRESCCKGEITMVSGTGSIGYGLYDIDGNGIKELLIGNINDGNVLALYTICADAPVNIFYGWSRSRYTIYSNGVIDNSGSSGAAYSEQHLFKINGADIEYITDFYFIETNMYYDSIGSGRSCSEVEESGYTGVEIVTSEFRDSKVKEITGEQKYSYDLIIF